MSEQFISVRLVKCNSLDLKLFQFNYDLTFSVFFLNADKTIYARYGTRSGHDADKDVHLSGLAATMKAALELHENYPDNRDSLTGKQSVSTDQSVPEDYQSLRHFKPDLDYKGEVSKSCIHCHQIRDAARLEFRSARKSLPEHLLFPYPAASTLGIRFNKQSLTKIESPIKDSPADGAGMKTGDSIVSFNGQSIHSEADFEWMLHHLAPDQTSIVLEVANRNSTRECNLDLPADWRKNTDLSWRPTTWILRRMTTGGVSLKVVDGNQKSKLGINAEKMAMEATHVGKYGQHAIAHRAGMRKGDIVISFDGRDDFLATNDLMEYALQVKKPGDKVEIGYLRNGKKRTASIRLQ